MQCQKRPPVVINIRWTTVFNVNFIFFFKKKIEKKMNNKQQTYWYERRFYHLHDQLQSRRDVDPKAEKYLSKHGTDWRLTQTEARLLTLVTKPVHMLILFAQRKCYSCFYIHSKIEKILHTCREIMTIDNIFKSLLPEFITHDRKTQKKYLKLMNNIR